MITRLLKPFISFAAWFKNASKKKKAGIIILFLIVLLVISGKLFGKKGDGYELTHPEKDSIVEIVTETGNVIVSNTIPLYSTTNGIIDQMYVTNGQSVQTGDQLFSVVSTATEQEKDAAYSTYLTAANTLDSAKADMYGLQATMFTKWSTFKDLAETETYKNVDDPNRNNPEFHIPQKEWLEAEADYKNQQSVVSQKQTDVSAKWLAYQATQDSTVVSTANGTVGNISAAEGQRVSVFSSTISVQPVLILSTPTQTTIKLDINETDISKIGIDQPATIKVDALDNQTFKGHVIRMDTIGTNTQGVITYSVYVAIDDPDQKILPGMTTSVDIEVARKENILTVPSSSVKPYKGGKAVRVVGKDGAVEYIPVEVGIQGDGKSEIISGIDETTEIIEALKNEQVGRKSSGIFGG